MVHAGDGVRGRVRVRPWSSSSPGGDGRGPRRGPSARAPRRLAGAAGPLRLPGDLGLASASQPCSRRAHHDHAGPHDPVPDPAQLRADHLVRAGAVGVEDEARGDARDDVQLDPELLDVEVADDVPRAHLQLDLAAHRHLHVADAMPASRSTNSHVNCSAVTSTTRRSLARAQLVGEHQVVAQTSSPPAGLPARSRPDDLELRVADRGPSLSSPGLARKRHAGSRRSPPSRG